MYSMPWRNLSDPILDLRVNNAEEVCAKVIVLQVISSYDAQSAAESSAVSYFAGITYRLTWTPFTRRVSHSFPL